MNRETDDSRFIESRLVNRNSRLAPFAVLRDTQSDTYPRRLWITPCKSASAEAPGAYGVFQDES